MGQPDPLNKYVCGREEKIFPGGSVGEEAN